jgi:hypothetical protein
MVLDRREFWHFSLAACNATHRIDLRRARRRSLVSTFTVRNALNCAGGSLHPTSRTAVRELRPEGLMIDSTVRARGDSPRIWEIEEASSERRSLGQIVQTAEGFFVFSGKGSLLEQTQISPGPYPSRHDAMDAIAAKLGGFCTLALGGVPID